MYAPAAWLAPMAKVAPTVKFAVPPVKVGVRPAVWLKVLTVIEVPGPARVAVVGNVMEYAELPSPVTLKAAAVIVPPNEPTPPVVVKPPPVDNTAVPVVVDAVTVPKLIEAVELMAIGVAIVTLAELVTLAAFAAPEMTRVVRATAEAIFKEMFIF